MKGFLTDTERAVLRAQHRFERDRRVADRIKAVLLSDSGWSYKAIAEILMLDEETIAKHVKDYQEKKKLKPENGGSDSKLSSSQTDEWIAHLEAHTYVKVEDICQHLFKTYAVRYSRQGMTNWLHSHKFSYKQPKEVPAKADASRQREFVDTYAKLCKTAPEEDPILFMDSVHPTMATKVSCGWIRTGKDKLIASIANRTRVNLTGALNLETMGVVSQDYETINGDSTINFLQKIRGAYPKASWIHIILDQSSYHTKKEVIEFAKKMKIKLHFLPPYSPNLNAIERLWKVMNEFVRNNRVFSSAREFRQSLLDFFEQAWPRIGPTMIDRINDNFHFLQSASSF